MTLAEAISFLSPRQRARAVKPKDRLAEGVEFGSVGVVGQGFVDEIGDLCDIDFLHPTGYAQDQGTGLLSFQKRRRERTPGFGKKSVTKTPRRPSHDQQGSLVGSFHMALYGGSERDSL